MKHIDIAELLECDERPFLATVDSAYRDEGEIGPQTSEAIARIRSELNELTHSRGPLERTRLAKMDVLFRKRDAEAYHHDHADVDVLTRTKRISQFLLGANREQWVEFASWYQDRVRELDASLAESKPILDDASLIMTDTLIDAGIYPKKASSIIEQVIDWAGPLKPIGSIEAALRPMNAVCDEDGIAISNLYAKPLLPGVIGHELRETMHHEHLHGVSFVGKQNLGLFDGLLTKDSARPHSWLEEVFAALATRQATDIRTDGRADAGPPDYPHETSFYNLVVEAAPFDIDLSDLAAAHFSPRRVNSKPRLHVATGLSIAIQSLFSDLGPNAFQAIDAGYNRRLDTEVAGAYMASLAIVGRHRLYGETA